MPDHQPLDPEQFFMQVATGAEAPDIMDFTVTREEDAPGGPMISMEALTGLGENLTMFIGSRLLAHHEATGDQVRDQVRKLEVRVHVSVNDSSIIPLVNEFLWWDRNDEAGGSALDGEARQ